MSCWLGISGMPCTSHALSPLVAPGSGTAQPSTACASSGAAMTCVRSPPCRPSAPASQIPLQQGRRHPAGSTRRRLQPCGGACRQTAAAGDPASGCRLPRIDPTLRACASLQPCKQGNRLDGWVCRLQGRPWKPHPPTDLGEPPSACAGSAVMRMVPCKERFSKQARVASLHAPPAAEQLREAALLERRLLFMHRQLQQVEAVHTTAAELWAEAGQAPRWGR